jgi:hypothetical protein
MVLQYKYVLAKAEEFGTGDIAVTLAFSECKSIS